MKLGTNNIGSVYLGTNAVQKVYLGTNEVWSSFTGLLDTYSGAAAAYSLRLLRSAYTGSAIRVRRASDNTEQDIGFVSGELDTLTLTSFCSGTNGFVKTWYDQSGNGRDTTQTTAANQPQIVSSGSVITENGKPCVDFNIAANIYLNKLSITPFTGFSHILIGTPKTLRLTGFIGMVGMNDGVGSAIGVRPTLKLYDFNGNIANANAANNTVSLNEQVLLYSQNISNTAQLFKNGTSISTATGTTGAEDDIILGNNGTYAASGALIQEYILYTSDQSSNRTGIETNINDFYSIY